MADAAGDSGAQSVIKSRPMKGNNKLARQFNSMLSDMKAAEPVAGSNTTVSHTGSGTAINATGAGANDGPLTVEDNYGHTVENVTEILFTDVEAEEPTNIVESADPGVAIVHIGSGNAIDVFDNDGGEVDAVSSITFENTDPEEGLDHLTVESDGEDPEGAVVRFPTEEVTGAVNGAPATLVIVTDGTGWQEI